MKFSHKFFCVARDLRKNTTRLDEICDETERKWSSSIKLSRGFHSSPEQRNENRWHLFIFFRWVNLSQIRSNSALYEEKHACPELRERAERENFILRFMSLVLLMSFGKCHAHFPVVLRGRPTTTRHKCDENFFSAMPAGWCCFVQLHKQLWMDGRVGWHRVKTRWESYK